MPVPIQVKHHRGSERAVVQSSLLVCIQGGNLGSSRQILVQQAELGCRKSTQLCGRNVVGRTGKLSLIQRP